MTASQASEKRSAGSAGQIRARRKLDGARS